MQTNFSNKTYKHEFKIKCFQKKKKKKNKRDTDHQNCTTCQLFIHITEMNVKTTLKNFDTPLNAYFEKQQQQQQNKLAYHFIGTSDDQTLWTVLI